MSLTNPTNRPPTQVAPNAKCNGCEHYCPQLGQAGMCAIGTFPQICGDGSDPEHGYRPLAGGITEMGLMSDPATPGSNVPSDQVSIPFVVVELSKSLAKRARATSGCQLPHARPTGGGMAMSLDVPIANGLCCCPKGAELAKEIRKGLPLHYQRRLSDDDVLELAKGNQPKKRSGEGSHGGRVIGHTKSGKPVYAPSSEHVAAYKKMVENRNTASEDEAYAETDKHVEHAHQKLNYSRQDHRDASALHREEAKKRNNGAGESHANDVIADTHNGYSRKPNKNDPSRAK